METLEKISNNANYKQILADSFGGVMYNVANRDKYDTTEILALWNSLADNVQDSAGGIMKGAMNFISGK
jgi:hypothetical protein